MRKSNLWLFVLCGIAFSCSARAGTVFNLSTPDPEVAAISTAAENYAAMVASLTNGAITLEIHPNGKLFAGDPGRAIRMTGSGSLDMLLLPASLYANQKPRFITLSFPYMFETVEQMTDYLYSEQGNVLRTDVEELNIHVIGFWPRSFRVITNSKHEIGTPADLQGLRLRVPNNPLWMEFFRSMGALPAPMPFGEVYQALKSKTVDGQENPVSVPMDARFFEVQKYLTLSNHIADAWVLGINKDKWNALTADQRDALTKASDKVRQTKIRPEMEECGQTIEFLKRKGMEIRSLNDDERKLFVETAEKLYPHFAEMVGDAEFVDQAMQFVGKKK